MTPHELQDRLSALLSGLLGTYTTPGGLTRPAIYVGDPPSGWTANGLEVIVEHLPEFDNLPLHQRAHVRTERPVRFIPHGPGAAAATEAAARRVSQALDATNPTTIPGDERLGILTQYVVRVRSH